LWTSKARAERRGTGTGWSPFPTLLSSSFFPDMTDLICVDAAAQEDLMMLDQLARTVLQRQATGVRQMVLQGSGETHERKLETQGLDITRRNGALTCTDPLLELAFRETNRSWANRFTDEGLHALALLGSDRGFIRMEGAGITFSPRFEASAWPSPAVIPVLGTLARDGNDGLVDVHPVQAATSLEARQPGGFRIVVLTRRSLPRNVLGTSISRAAVLEHGWLAGNVPLPPEGTSWLLAEPGLWAAGRAVEVQ
jgi:hypothetical protein